MELCEYDLETALAMLSTKRYLYVAFMCHQSAEKALKGFYSSKFDSPPPFTHNLKHLVELCEMNEKLNEEMLVIIDTLTPLNIEARYPTYKEQLIKLLNEERCNEILFQTKKLIEWIKQQL